MGIDYVIDLACEPKRAFTLEGLVGRLKGRERAASVIQLYRAEGDERPPSQMGFEMVRRTSDGTEEVEMIVVQDLLDAADELSAVESHCVGCRANRARQPFGCLGSINYPISLDAERWLLAQLPGNDDPLLFVLLQKALREMGYTGDTAAALRARFGVFMESVDAVDRDVGGMVVTADQVFELLFLAGGIRPAHGAMLLQFFGGISRNLDADIMMQLAAPPSDDWIEQHVPFLHRPDPGDDDTVQSIKAFFQALYLSFRLGFSVLLDV
jgi:hypothetical protein